MKSELKLAGLIAVFVLVVAISGCTSVNQVQNKTFNKGGITFQYPGTWSDNITFNYAQAPSSQWTTLGTIGDNTTSVSITSMNLSASAFSATSIESLAQLAYSTSSGSVQPISFNNSNYNNITFYELIYTNKDSVSNGTYKNYQLFFGEQGKILYSIIFKTKETDFQKNYQLFKEIQSSIKYT